jgi:RecJ-like exonuclease
MTYTRNTTLVFETCPKCGGKGYLDHCLHIKNGICFQCNGTGKIKRPMTQAEQTKAFAMPEVEIDLTTDGPDDQCVISWLVQAGTYGTPSYQMRHGMVGVGNNTLHNETKDLLAEIVGALKRACKISFVYTDEFTPTLKPVIDAFANGETFVTSTKTGIKHTVVHLENRQQHESEYAALESGEAV